MRDRARKTGRTRAARLTVAAMLALAIAWSAPAAAPQDADAPPKSHAELLDRLAKMRGFSARFVETKTLSLLAMPLESEGEIHFEAPRRLLRHTLAPNESRVLIDRERVVIAEAGHMQEIDLEANAPIRPLVESLLWILSGQHDRIESAYASEYAIGDDGRSWTLELAPRTSPLDQMIRGLVVRGTGGTPTRFDVVEVNGDRSVTELIDANTNRRFSDEERARLFEFETP